MTCWKNFSFLSLRRSQVSESFIKILTTHSLFSPLLVLFIIFPTTTRLSSVIFHKYLSFCLPACCLVCWCRRLYRWSEDIEKYFWLWRSTKNIFRARGKIYYVYLLRINSLRCRHTRRYGFWLLLFDLTFCMIIAFWSARAHQLPIFIAYRLKSFSN